MTKPKPMSISFVLAVLAIGLIAGLMSSLVGIGGGIIVVPALALWLGFSQISAQGTSLAMLSLPVALVAAINYSRQGHVDWKVALLLAISFVVGGYLGSRFALSLEVSMVKKIFALFMIVVAIKYLFFDK